jgi:hypothetical protein
MPRFQRILVSVATLSLITFGATFLVERTYQRKAQLIQRVEYDSASAALLGEVGPMVGSPQMMIIEDPKAFIGGNGPMGSLLVNDLYLKSHQIYPLQLQTVGFALRLTRQISLAMFAFASLGFSILISRRRQLR